MRPTSVVFTATEWNKAEPVRITATADADAEDEQVTIGHTVAGADHGSASAADVAVTVVGDETPSTAIKLRADRVSVAEGGGDRTVTVTAALDEAALKAETTVQVAVGAETATPGEDFAVVDAFEVTIPAGAASGSATFTLSPVSDDVDEDDETLSLTGQVVESGTPVVDALPVTLAVKSDGVLVRMDSEAAGRLPAATADVHRLRLLLEGSFAALRGPSGVLTPSLEVGARYDGGAAETGAGLELGGGLRYAYPAWGLTIAANGRWLIVHEDRAHQQWGVGASIRVAPVSASRGPSLTLNTACGDTANTVQQLWSQGAALPGGSGAEAAFVLPGRFEAELGYGIEAPGGAVVTPYAGVALEDGGAHAYRVGRRLSLAPALFSTSRPPDTSARTNRTTACA